MENIVLFYFLGALIVTDLMLAWFATEFPVLLFRRDNRQDLYDFWLLVLGPVLHDLLTCCVCLSTWVSAFVAAVLCLTAGQSWWLVPAAMFTWPLICFIILRELDIV